MTREDVALAAYWFILFACFVGGLMYIARGLWWLVEALL